MKKMHVSDLGFGIVGAIILVGVIFGVSTLPTGERDHGVIENIHGIPFPDEESSILITEDLAHTDVYLREPVVYKNLQLTVTAEPVDATRLSVGVRKDSFWLSYDKEVVFEQGQQGPVTKTLEIPLTDKLQERDRSIDVIFFAESTSDAPVWKLHNISFKTTRAMPSRLQLKDYIRSVIKRERAL